MRLERWWDMEADSGGVQAADLPLVPDGEHVAKIVKAEWRDLKFRVSDKNTDGTSLCLDLEVAGYKRLEAIADVTWRGMIEAICRAASQPTPNPREDWNPKVLVGQYVRVDCVQGVGKTGREYVKVTKFQPGREPLPESIRKTPPRAATKAQEGEADDIPF